MKVLNAFLLLSIFQVTTAFGQFNIAQKQKLLEEINKNVWKRRVVCAYFKSEYVCRFNEEANLDH